MAVGRVIGNWILRGMWEVFMRVSLVKFSRWGIKGMRVWFGA